MVEFSSLIFRPVRSTKQETTTANQRKQTTKKIQAKCNRLISNWKNQNYIDKWEAKRLRRYNSVIAKTYGQIKIHKQGQPPRPVVSSTNTPTYNL